MAVKSYLSSYLTHSHRGNVFFERSEKNVSGYIQLFLGAYTYPCIYLLIK